MTDIPDPFETNEVAPKKEEDFPKEIFCPQCKRSQVVQTCQVRNNVLLTETQICCPRCRRKLKKIRLKEWYDHYVLGFLAPPRGEGD